MSDEIIIHLDRPTKKLIRLVVLKIDPAGSPPSRGDEYDSPDEEDGVFFIDPYTNIITAEWVNPTGTTTHCPSLLCH